MEKPKRTLAVIMQRRELANQWQSEAWEPWGVLADGSTPGEPRLIVDERGLQQWLHPGFELALHRDELDGYYMNVSSQRPKVFVLWLVEEDHARPLQLTASYHEASRWMDAGAVEGVAMPPEIYAWVGKYVEDNYRPEPEKRVKPRSFLSPKDRVQR